MVELSLKETRILGALLEKATTTPDQYPLTLNALTAACNQKSNREPVMSLSDTEVQEIVDELIHKKLVAESSFGSRVTKFKHRFCNTEFSELHLNPQELSIICVLFLRGPQTPGELRTRTNRLYAFTDVHEVEETLLALQTKEATPLVAKLDREPGKRESRYAHLFSGPVELSMIQQNTEAVDDLSSSQANSSEQEERITALE